MLSEWSEFGMKCLLQIRTSKTQTDQNNYSVKTFSLKIFLIKNSKQSDLIHLILTRPILIIGYFNYRISRLKLCCIGIQSTNIV